MLQCDQAEATDAASCTCPRAPPCRSMMPARHHIAIFFLLRVEPIVARLLQELADHDRAFTPAFSRSTNCASSAATPKQTLFSKHPTIQPDQGRQSCPHHSRPPVAADRLWCRFHGMPRTPNRRSALHPSSPHKYLGARSYLMPVSWNGRTKVTSSRLRLVLTAQYRLQVEPPAACTQVFPEFSDSASPTAFTLQLQIIDSNPWH